MMKADSYRGFLPPLWAYSISALPFYCSAGKKWIVMYVPAYRHYAHVCIAYGPIQLHGHFITLFWASECVLLYWLYQRSTLAIIRASSFIVWIAMLVSLSMDWSTIYSMASLALPIVFNKGFITTFMLPWAPMRCFTAQKEGPASGIAAYYLPAAGFFRIRVLYYHLLPAHWKSTTSSCTIIRCRHQYSIPAAL